MSQSFLKDVTLCDVSEHGGAHSVRHPVYPYSCVWFVKRTITQSYNQTKIITCSVHLTVYRGCAGSTLLSMQTVTDTSTGSSMVLKQGSSSTRKQHSFPCPFAAVRDVERGTAANTKRRRKKNSSLQHDEEERGTIYQ
jgi:hypothetical protein